MGIYDKYLSNLGGAKKETGDLFGQLLSGAQSSREEVANRYGLMEENLRRMAETSSGQARQGYGAARQRVEAAPTAYQQPAYNALPVSQVPMVGADAGTVAGLQTSAQQGAAAESAAISQLYDQLAQSEAANRASRLSDIDIAQTSDLAQLAGLAQSQQFGLGQSRASELSDIDQLITAIGREQIAANLGFDERELAALQGQATFDTDAMTQSITAFRSIIDPIVDIVDPQDIVKFWMEFANQVGMPVDQAVSMAGQF